MQAVRPAAVAGLFYPGRRIGLVRVIEDLLSQARTELGPQLDEPLPKALLLPHAGYAYSGSTAALGYALLAPRAAGIHRVVLLGPTHRVPVDGLALPDAEAMATPLGEVAVETLSEATRQRLPQVVDSVRAHALEHSLEVHLPFLQVVLPKVRVLPLAVGRAEPDEVAAVLDAVWGGSDTVVIVSSDLSHYLPYDRARRTDAETVEQILHGRPVTPEQACGAYAVNGLLVAAGRRGLTGRLLGMRTSGDTAGDRRRVVGYAALAFTAADGH